MLDISSFFCQTKYADSFEDSQCAESIDIARIFGDIKADLNMALGSEVVNLVRLNFSDDSYER